MELLQQVAASQLRQLCFKRSLLGIGGLKACAELLVTLVLKVERVVCVCVFFGVEG